MIIVIFMDSQGTDSSVERWTCSDSRKVDKRNQKSDRSRKAADLSISSPVKQILGMQDLFIYIQNFFCGIGSAASGIYEFGII